MSNESRDHHHDDFPRTAITPRTYHHSSAQRSLEITHLVDHTAGAPRGETYPASHVVAILSSRTADGSPFSAPRVSFSEGGGYSAFTRREWERIKREVDEAFDTFEATWPMDREHEIIVAEVP